MSLATAWLLADELDCTIDELAGRSVPDQAPKVPAYTENEVRIINAYRSATPQGRAAIEAVARSQEGVVGQPPGYLEDTG